MTKERERWTDAEHASFLEALRIHGRAWRSIEGAPYSPAFRDPSPRDGSASISRCTMYWRIMSMAALGLGVDVRSVLRAGSKVTAVVVMSLLLLGILSYTLIVILASA